MPLLTLKRDAYYGNARKLKIVINGNKVVRLKYLEETNIDLPAGKHTLIAKMDWAKSLPLSVTLDEGEHAYVLAGCIPRHLATIGILIPPFRIFTLKRISRPA